MIANKSAAQRTHAGMGTVMTHKAFGRHAEEAVEAAVKEIVHLERLLSRFLPDSEISRISACAGIRSERVSADTYALLERAVQFARQFPGCLDVTIGPLVSLWTAAKGFGEQPDELSISKVRPLVNYRDLLLDSRSREAGLRRAGQSLDLGGIGKGFAGDRVLEVYRRYGISSAYANLGGNVVTLGTKPDGSPWQIGIQHPRQEQGLIGRLSVVNASVVTSGDYQRYFTDRQGRRHHHILDPGTGYPAASGLISVSVVASESLVADALSTALFVAGMDRGLAFLKRYTRAEAILVDSKLQVHITQGLRHRFQADEGIELAILD